MSKEQPSHGKANLYEFPQLRRITGDTLRPGGLSITAKALELCGFPAGATLLDVGCGAGATLAFLREQGFRPVGVDASLVLLHEAQQHGFVLAADAHQLPFADAVFAGVLCECVVSLFQDAAQALAEIGRVVVPGGWLAVSDMVRLEPWQGVQAISERGNGASPKAQAVSGMALENSCLQGAKSRQKMEALFAEAGFTVRHVIDYRKALAAMSAKMVWEFGSIDAFWELWRCHAPHGCRAAPCAKSLGYELFIGQKKD